MRCGNTGEWSIVAGDIEREVGDGLLRGGNVDRNDPFYTQWKVNSTIKNILLQQTIYSSADNFG